ncbi:hypothetical protein ACLBTR_22695, partial [Pseudomonas aeruginosa]
GEGQSAALDSEGVDVEQAMPVGARPAAPNPMELEEQQAPADAPPVEGGFDAAPPAQ